MTGLLWVTLGIGGLIMFACLMLAAFVSTVQEFRDGLRYRRFLAGRLVVASFFGTLVFSLALTTLSLLIDTFATPHPIR